MVVFNRTSGHRLVAESSSGASVNMFYFTRVLTSILLISSDGFLFHFHGKKNYILHHGLLCVQGLLLTRD